MSKRVILLLLFLIGGFSHINAQVVINEFLSSNSSGITDEDNDFSDWIELYNSSENELNLEGYILTDKIDKSSGWVFPEVIIQAKSYLLLYASGKDRKIVRSQLHTIIKRDDSWKYYVPISGMPENWRNPNFDDSLWASGPSGFGFNDGDDATQINNLQTILIRKEFEIQDTSSINEMLLHVDYDDGFLAFINGMLVARGSISSYNEDYSVVQATNHEAVMYSDGDPELFNITDFISCLRNGKNVIAIQGHNTSSTSTDFSLIPFLTLGSKDYIKNEVESFIHVENGNLHTNFKISKEGEPLYLFNPSFKLIDSVRAIALLNDVSFGRFEDGDTAFFYFEQPTPGNINLNPVSHITRDSVTFSTEAGFYSQTFDLNMIASSSGRKICYTTDGSVPTFESTLFLEPLPISGTTVIRAAIFNDSIQISPIYTKTFIFNALSGLPTISISSDPKNFFDWEEGIFELGPNAEPNNPNFGANFWMDWEKPINFEYIDKNGTAQINQEAGIKVSGQWSRANALKSVSIFARKNYGKGSFNYKFFNDRENQSFESITLRNSGNDWSYSMMRDGLVSEIAKGMDIDRLAYQPAVIYLNGEYWGILNMREKTSEHYFKENFGIKEGNLNLIEYSPTNGILLVYGTSDDYQIMHNFVDSKSLLNANNYDQVSEMMDIGSFIDYELLEIFIDNGDWPGNNCKLWKTNNPLSKWRWLIYDTDFGFNLFHSNGNTLDFATASNGESWPNPPWATLYLRKLLANEAFKIQFVNRFSDCLNSNLLASSIDSKVDSIQNILEPEIQNHLNRWLFSHDTWKYHVGRIKYFTFHRKTDMRKFMSDFFDFKLDFVITLSVSDNFSGKIKINSIVPANYPFKGNYFGEVPITLKAIPNPGYRFVRWEVGSNSTDQNIVVNLTANKTFSAVFEPVIENNNQLVINEINYKSSDENDTGDWIEIFNNGDQTVDLTGWIIHDDDTSNQFIFPAGQLIYPKEYLVINENNTKFQSIYPGITNSVGEFKFGLSSSGDIINLFDNEGNLIDKVRYGAQLPWPVEPSGTGATLELNALSLDNELAENWSASKPGGTPGSRNSVMVSANIYTEAVNQTSCFPTCFSDYTTLRFSSPAGSSYLVQILDMQGRNIETLSGISKSDGINYLDLFTETDHFIAGIYFVKVQTKTRVQSVKVIKR
jgi:hypothetical protein